MTRGRPPLTCTIGFEDIAKIVGYTPEQVRTNHSRKAFNIEDPWSVLTFIARTAPLDKRTELFRQMLERGEHAAGTVDWRKKGKKPKVAKSKS
jgi:hypothetical protein